MAINLLKVVRRRVGFYNRDCFIYLSFFWTRKRQGGWFSHGYASFLFRFKLCALCPWPSSIWCVDPEFVSSTHPALYTYQSISLHRRQSNCKNITRKNRQSKAARNKKWRGQVFHWKYSEGHLEAKGKGTTELVRRKVREGSCFQQTVLLAAMYQVQATKTTAWVHFILFLRLKHRIILFFCLLFCEIYRISFIFDPLDIILDIACTHGRFF